MSKNPILEKLTNNELKENTEHVYVGDTIEVTILVQEGSKSRPQKHQGVVTRVAKKGNMENITIRKLSGTFGVNITFYRHSTVVSGIRTVKIGKVRQSRLGYLYGTTGKRAKIALRHGGRTSLRAPLAVVNTASPAVDTKSEDSK